MDEVQQRNDRIVDAYRDGCTVTELQQAFGLSRSWIYEILKARNVALRPRKAEPGQDRLPTREERAMMLRMRAEGESPLAIGEELGFSRSTVKAVLQNATSREVQRAIAASVIAGEDSRNGRSRPDAQRARASHEESTVGAPAPA